VDVMPAAVDPERAGLLLHGSEAGLDGRSFVTHEEPLVGIQSCRDSQPTEVGLHLFPRDVATLV
jgi:hypothetical protein